MQSNSFEKISKALEVSDKTTFSVVLADCADFGQAYLMQSFKIEPDLAYDCVMNIIEKMIEQFDKLTEMDDLNFNGYFLKALKNEFLQYHRKEKRIYTNENIEQLREQYELTQYEIFEVLYDSNDIKKLRKCMRRLKGEESRLIEWSADNLKPEADDIHAFFNININAYYQRKSRIIKKIKKCMGLF